MKKILVVVLAYNEEKSIVNTVEKVISLGLDYVVINDASRDSTEAILKARGYNYITHPINLGIGGGMATGWKYAYEKGYDSSVQFDGDGQHNGDEILAMYEKMKAEKADMVIASRFITKEGFQSTKLRKLGIQYISWLIKMLTGKKIYDPTSGFRLVSRRVMKLFFEDYPKDYPEQEKIVLALKRGYRIVEVPTYMYEREHGVSSINFKRTLYYFFKVSLGIIFAAFERIDEVEE